MNDIFRAAHTLKGMSATMGYEDLANLTHYMENVLDGIRNEKIKVTSKELDAVFFAVDHLEAMVESIASGGDGKRDVTDAIHMLMQIEKGSEPIQTAARVKQPQLPRKRIHKLTYMMNIKEPSSSRRKNRGFSAMK